MLRKGDGTDAKIIARPMTEGDLDALATIFACERTTRHCWCTAFCSTPCQFALGWFGGGNARRFAAMVAGSANPMGILAFRDDEAVGWCACGPRSRYAAVDTPRNKLIRDLDPADHPTTWFVPCFYVKAGYRDRGVTRTLALAAVELARREGAASIEGWPLAESVGRSADAFVGREQVFASVGFRPVARPTPGRVIMRMDP